MEPHHSREALLDFHGYYGRLTLFAKGRGFIRPACTLFHCLPCAFWQICSVVDVKHCLPARSNSIAHLPRLPLNGFLLWTTKHICPKVGALSCPVAPYFSDCLAHFDSFVTWLTSYLACQQGPQGRICIFRGCRFLFRWLWILSMLLKAWALLSFVDRLARFRQVTCMVNFETASSGAAAAWFYRYKQSSVFA